MSPSPQSLARMALIAAGLLLTTGCSKDKPEHKYTTREGKALDIDPEGGVSMEFVNSKGVRMKGKGKVAPEAEIWINGRQATLTDVRPGDYIKATLRIEGSGMNKSFTATKIEVERDAFESTSRPATSQPASDVAKTATDPS